jgi:hypothetical protein
MMRPRRLLVRLALGAVALVGVGACVDDESPLAPRTDGLTTCGSRPLTLAVGEAAAPSNRNERRCEVAAIAGAEYVVAWLDTRAIDAARVGTEPSFEPYPITLSIAPDASLSAARPADARAAVLAASDATAPLPVDRTGTRSGVLEARPRHRRTSWVLDEEFLLDDDYSGLPRPAQIVRVYDGGIVIARWADDPTDDLALYLAQLDTAVALVQEHVRPLLRHAFTATDPSSTQAGQFLMLLQQDVVAPARSFSEVSGDTLYTWMDLLPYPWLSATRLAQTLAHEITHSYQRAYMHATRSAPGVPSTAGAASWAVEGGANLVSYELLRRLTGLPLDANREWRSPATSVAMSLFQQRAQPAGGVITDGFDAAMGFFRDLTMRRIAAGESTDDALRAVSRGAIEGWFGLDGVSQRPGLTARMRERLGGAWEPADALLDWALSHAADDLTPNPRYQDRASLRVWDLPGGQTYGWWSDAVLTPSAPTFTLFKRFGSPGWARITDGAAGFTVEVQGYEVPTRWLLLRIR